MKPGSTVVKLIELLQEVRERTLALITDLDDEQLIGPRLGIVNPLRWEIGHLAWFQEYWVLRYLNHRAPIVDSGDALYDSALVAHETRWDLPLPSTANTISYMQRVLDQVVHLYDREENPREPTDDATYFLSLVLLHEDMHAEAITYTRQTLAYPAPRFKVVDEIARSHSNESNGDVRNHEPLRDELGDAFVPGGKFVLGSIPGKHFVFDNEMSAHEVEVPPYAISRTAVTNVQYAAFVDDGGYDHQACGVMRGGAGAKVSAESIRSTGGLPQVNGGAETLMKWFGLKIIRRCFISTV
jgi:iron(II)-dependent oxidoreductase